MPTIWLTVGMAILALLSRSLHLRTLVGYAFSSRRPLNLDFSPTQLSWPDRGFLLLLLLYKALLAATGHSSSKLKASKDGKALFDLPQLELTCPVIVSLDDVRRYSEAAMLPQGSEKQAVRSPAFLMAALTNPLMLLLVVHPQFPVAPLGAVNVRNRFDFLQVSQSSVQDRHFSASAVAGGPGNPGRRTKRGIEFDIVVTVYDRHTLVLRQIITIMKPLSRRLKPAPPTDQTSDPVTEPNSYQPLGRLTLPTHAPTLWANLCGDFNPIHMSSTLARLFGLPGRIAHGNHVVAAFLQLAYTHPEFNSISSQPWYLEAEFRRPMVLPIALDAEISAGRDDNAVFWQCRKGDKTYVSGRMGHLE